MNSIMDLGRYSPQIYSREYPAGLHDVMSANSRVVAEEAKVWHRISLPELLCIIVSIVSALLFVSGSKADLISRHTRVDISMLVGR